MSTTAGGRCWIREDEREEEEGVLERREAERVGVVLEVVDDLQGVVFSVVEEDATGPKRSSSSASWTRAPCSAASSCSSSSSRSDEAGALLLGFGLSGDDSLGANLEVESTETLRFLDGVEAGDGKGRTAVR